MDAAQQPDTSNQTQDDLRSSQSIPYSYQDDMSSEHQDFDQQQQPPRPPAAPSPNELALQPPQQQQQQVQPRYVHRPSFTPPFPVPVASSAAASAAATPSTPLTNHEIYELQRKASISPFKQPAKRASLYVQPRGHALERQSSMLARTPGFDGEYLHGSAPPVRLLN